MNIETKRDLLNILRRDYARHHPGEKEMDDNSIHYLWDICNKLCRLACTPNHIDSWHDIAGYATRVEETLKRKRGEK